MSIISPIRRVNSFIRNFNGRDKNVCAGKLFPHLFHSFEFLILSVASYLFTVLLSLLVFESFSVLVFSSLFCILVETFYEWNNQREKSGGKISNKVLLELAKCERCLNEMGNLDERLSWLLWRRCQDSA